MPQVATANPLANSELLTRKAVPSVFGFIATVADATTGSSTYIPQYGARELSVSYLSAAGSEPAPAATPVATGFDYGVEELAQSQHDLDGLFEHEALQWIPDIDETEQLSATPPAVSISDERSSAVADEPVDFPQSANRRRLLTAARLLGTALAVSAVGYIAVRPDIPAAHTPILPSVAAKAPQRSQPAALQKSRLDMPLPAATPVPVQKAEAATVIPPSVRAVATSSLPLPRVEAPPVIFEQARQRETEPRISVKESAPKEVPANGKIVLLDPDVPVQRKDDIPSPGKFVLFTDANKNSAAKPKSVQEQQ